MIILDQKFTAWGKKLLRQKTSRNIVETFTYHTSPTTKQPPYYKMEKRAEDTLL